jgi:hypothetical protein
MTSNRTRRLAEVIGLLGVVASLIFVGVEVRQNSVATRAATDAAVADGYRDLNLAIATSSDLARVFAEHAADPGAAPAEDQILMLGLWRALFHIWSNSHRQHLNGTLDPAIFDGVVQEMKTYSGTPSIGAPINQIERRRRFMQWAWESERFIFNPDFQLFVDSLLAAGPRPAS